MTTTRFNIKAAGVIALFLSMAFVACKYDVKELGAGPEASFTVTPVAGKVNTYAVASTSKNAFIHEWDSGLGAWYRGTAMDTFYYADKGNYTVRLRVYGAGGQDSTSQVISVANDDPSAMTPLKQITGNSTKTWKLAPEAGALLIGPSDFSQVWWQNSVADIAGRSCQFNDEITFNKNGSVNINMKGDFYVDEEAGAPHPAGMPPVGCYPVGSIPSQFQAWTGGNHTFTITNTHLTMNGTGAFMGLYKAGTTNAAVPAPQASVTYQIVSLTATRLVLKIDYGWGAWRFTYVPA